MRGSTCSARCARRCRTRGGMNASKVEVTVEAGQELILLVRTTARA